MNKSELPKVKLKCLDEESAIEVMRLVDEVPPERRHDNSAVREGDTIVITYYDKRWPYDIADMAGELGLASDDDSSWVISCL